MAAVGGAVPWDCPQALNYEMESEHVPRSDPWNGYGRGGAGRGVGGGRGGGQGPRGLPCPLWSVADCPVPSGDLITR